MCTSRIGSSAIVSDAGLDGALASATVAVLCTLALPGDPLVAVRGLAANLCDGSAAIHPGSGCSLVGSKGGVMPDSGFVRTSSWKTASPLTVSEANQSSFSQ